MRGRCGDGLAGGEAWLRPNVQCRVGSSTLGSRVSERMAGGFQSSGAPAMTSCAAHHTACSELSPCLCPALRLTCRCLCTACCTVGGAGFTVSSLLGCWEATGSWWRGLAPTRLSDLQSISWQVSITGKPAGETN